MLKYLSTSLIANFFFSGRSKVARRRLRLLSDRGYISYFEKISHCRYGRLERVWHLDKKRKTELSHIIDSDNVSFHKPPANALYVNHYLKICEFILCLKRGCEVSGKYSFKFFIEYESHAFSRKREGRRKLPIIGKGKTPSVPDALIILQNSEGIKSLFFVEIDLATETLVSASKNKKDIRNKIITYMNYLACKGYKQLCKEFDFDFKGFRLLILTISEARLRRLIELCEEIGTRGVAWLSTFDRVSQGTIFNPIWQVPCSEKKELRSIVKGHSAK